MLNAAHSIAPAASIPQNVRSLGLQFKHTTEPNFEGRRDPYLIESTSLRMLEEDALHTDRQILSNAALCKNYQDTEPRPSSSGFLRAWRIIT